MTSRHSEPSILSGIGFACFIGLASVLLTWGLQLIFPFGRTFQAVMVVGYLSYLLFLVRERGARIGGLTLFIANLIGVSALYIFSFGAVWLAQILAVGIVVNRSLLFYRSWVAWVIDAVVVYGGLLFASYLFHQTGGFAVTLWGFYLVQSLFAPLCAFQSGKALWRPSPKVEPFHRSYKNAEAAIERMVRST